MGNLIIFLLLLGTGLFFGKMNERRHFARLARDEAELAHIKVLSIKTLPTNLVPGGVMVTGNVVIAIDYFKMILSSIRIIFGGRLNSYESLLERARREAIVRMQKEAAVLGANAIYNARVEFSAVGQTAKTISGAELLAYGTAVKLT